MLDAIKLIGDLVVGSVRAYGDKKKDLFETHVEPLHQRMLEIHGDYIAGFEQAKRYLENRENPTDEVIEFLEQRRREYLAEREIAANLAEELAITEKRFLSDEVWQTVRDYCEAIVNYFSTSSIVGGLSWYSDFLDIVKKRTGSRSQVSGTPWLSPTTRGTTC